MARASTSRPALGVVPTVSPSAARRSASSPRVGSAWARLALTLALGTTLGFGLTLGAAPSAAWADGKRDLEDGIAFYENLDAERAEQRLSAALGASDLSKRDRARAAMYLGLVHYENGKEPAAEKAWRQAFALDGNVEGPRGTSPKIVAAIDKVRRTAKKGAADDEATPPVAPKKGRVADTPPGPSAKDLMPAKVDKAKADPPRADKAEPKPEGARADATKADPAKADPTPNARSTAPKPPRLDPTPPIAPPPATTPPPVVAEPKDEGGFPWLWVGVGAAVVGGAVLGVVLASSGGGCSDGGCVRVRIGEAP